MDRAFRRRDPSYEGVFFTAVRTTGIFCRPTCPAKNPASENVEFFGSANEALLAGYRACRRCRPMDPNGRPPQWVDRLVAAVEKSPFERLSDAHLRGMSVDPVRARRYFQQNYGMTFQTYQRNRRMGLALAGLRNGKKVLDVAYGHGFESDSGFRDAFRRVFGEPPGRGRNSVCLVTAQIATPLGPMVTAASDEGICLFEFADRRGLSAGIETLRRRLGCAFVPGSNPHIRRIQKELARYFAGSLEEFKTPLVLVGTDFQCDVWRALRKIPHGRTMSYEGLARAIGRRGAQRAVGRANGDNRIAILIPCHRVVQKDGKLCG